MREFSESERSQITERIGHVLGFVQDVIDDPSVLDRIADGSTIELTPVEEIDRSKQYTANTRRFAVSEIADQAGKRSA